MFVCESRRESVWARGKEQWEGIVNKPGDESSTLLTHVKVEKKTESTKLSSEHMCSLTFVLMHTHTAHNHTNTEIISKIKYIILCNNK